MRIESVSDNKTEGDESAQLFFSTESAIVDYFTTINHSLESFTRYENAPNSIDFIKLRRFLLTTYNNLVDLDLDLKNAQVTDILKDLMSLSEIYDAFKQKSKQIKKAFYDLFLSRNDEFVHAQKRVESNKSAIEHHNSNIAVAEAAIAKLEYHIKKTPEASDYYLIIQERMKKAKGIIVDEIHAKRSQEEENFKLIQFIDMIITENEESFAKKYAVQAIIFDQKITDLLNKAAYVFDVSLWQYARDSKPIKMHFQKSYVKGQLSSLTYLKYYLQSLNHENFSAEQQELAALVPYLENLHRRKILYLTTEVENAMRLKSVITSIDKYIDLETTMNYDKMIESLMKEVPHYLFIDQQISGLKPLIKMLKSHGIMQKSNVVLVVDNVSESFMEQVKKIHIRYLLPTNVSPHVFTQRLTHILNEDPAV
ncbi:hypothetical protein [Sulfuricurvum sp.]|uniref:hypothetical protein n=1 Tax=Sulfuricurvum sp. TaxID=2025608 RepID=UPI002D634A8D|nr:hypothetical protein [Sulfuricurvum sp.]HZF70822.1 hypothetical protein [Sulfuricurvum sp.]